MLQQILRDMYVDPDILSELPEEQKEMLFFKIREEQIRRYNEREKENDKKNSRRKISYVTKNGGKKVRILEDAEGNPWTWIFGEGNGTVTVEEKWKRLSAHRMEAAIKTMLEEDQVSRQLPTAKKNKSEQDVMIIKKKPSSRSPSSSPPNRSPRISPVLNERKSSTVVSSVLKRKEANSTRNKNGNNRTSSPIRIIQPGSSPPKHGVQYGSSPLNHGVRPGSSPPKHGVQYGPSPPNHGVGPGSSPPKNQVQHGLPPPNHGVQPVSSPPKHGVLYGSSPPNQGVRPELSLPQNEVQYGSSPPNHRVRSGSSPPKHGIQYGSSPPNHGVRHGSSPPKHEFQDASSPPNHGFQNRSKPSIAPGKKIVRALPLGQKSEKPKTAPKPQAISNSNSSLVEKLQHDENSTKVAGLQRKKETKAETSLQTSHGKEGEESLYENVHLDPKRNDDVVSNEEWQRQLLQFKEADRRRSIRARRAGTEYRRQSLLASDPEKLRFRFKYLATANAKAAQERPPVPHKPETLRAKHPIPQPGKQSRPQSRAEVKEWFENTQVHSLSKTDSPSFPLWLHGVISRTNAEELLKNKQPGDYLIRVSDKIWGYALSYKDVDRIKHFLIDASEERCYHFFGNDQIRHESLDELILYHEEETISYNGEKLKNCVEQDDPKHPDYLDLECDASDTRL